jgi:hypothetical protein
VRTAEQGALTSADVAVILGVSMKLEAQAHGTAFAARDCEACKLMREQLGLWAGEHMLDADELAEVE